MMLSEAIRTAIGQGCELVPIPGTGRYLIRAIAYDADPCEISELALLDLSREEFLRDWMPERL